MASRQEQYRRRLLLKSRYFDEAEERRRHSIMRSMDAQPFADWPEVKKVGEFFLSHPRAEAVPTILVDDGWDVEVDRDKDPKAHFHLALAYVALRTVSGWPMIAQIVTDGGTGVLTDDDPVVQQVRREIAELVDLGMWVAE